MVLDLTASCGRARERSAFVPKTLERANAVSRRNDSVQDKKLFVPPLLYFESKQTVNVSEGGDKHAHFHFKAAKSTCC